MADIEAEAGTPGSVTCPDCGAVLAFEHHGRDEDGNGIDDAAGGLLAVHRQIYHGG